MASFQEEKKKKKKKNYFLLFIIKKGKIIKITNSLKFWDKLFSLFHKFSFGEVGSTPSLPLLPGPLWWLLGSHLWVK